MKIKEAYREVLGRQLKAFREDRGLTVREVARRGGIREEQADAVESGEGGCTLDDFLGYVAGSDLYIYFAEKSEGRELPHDFGDMAAKAAENDPEQ